MEVKYDHILRHCDICINITKTANKLFSIVSNLQTHFHFRLDFHNADRHTRGKWLTHGVKCRKNKRMPQKTAWNSNIEYLTRETKHDIEKADSNMFNPIFNENVEGQKHPGRCVTCKAQAQLWICNYQNIYVDAINYCNTTDMERW